MTARVVYHVSSAKFLRAIVESGELRTTKELAPCYLDRVLWATTDPKGEESALANCINDWRVIRFTLPAADFTPWFEYARKVVPPEKFAQFEAFLRKEPDCARDLRKWHVRPAALPINRVLRVDAWMDDRWRRRSIRTIERAIVADMQEHERCWDYECFPEEDDD